MPIIASHHKDDPYKLTCDWPDDCHVQWGGRGIVIGREGTTAFFEAFPGSGSGAGGFLRGEGKTIEEAELAAFDRFYKETHCDHHWGREDYTNGGMLCRFCRAFKTGLVPPLVTLGTWCSPIKRYETTFIGMFGAYESDQKLSKAGRRLELRKKYFGVVDS